MTRRLELTGLAITGLLLCFAATGVVAAPADTQAKDSLGQLLLRRSIGIGEAVDIALQNNPAVSSRRAALSSSAAAVGMAEAATRPQLSATLFATTGDMPMIVAGPSDVEPQNLSITPDRGRINQNVMLMYPLYTGGQLNNRVSSARAQREASLSYATTTDLDVALMVKTAYYKALLARRFVDAHQRRVDEAGERVRIADESFAAGRIARYDLLRNQTELAEARQELNNSELDVQMALIDLKSAMGISQSSELTLSEDLTLRQTDQTLESLTATAIEQRPEVAAARSQAHAAQSRLGAAKGAYKPQIYATAMADLSAIDSDGMGDDVETGYLVGISASIPILDGGMRKSAVAEADAMVAQMRADEREAAINVTREVAAAYAQSNTAVKNVSLAEAAVEQAEEDYRVIRMRYEAGKSTNVEVLDALAALTRARTNSAEALYAHNVARAVLARAVGQP